MRNEGKLVNAWVPDELADDAFKIAAIKREKISKILRDALRVYVNENNNILKLIKEYDKHE